MCLLLKDVPQCRLAGEVAEGTDTTDRECGCVVWRPLTGSVAVWSGDRECGCVEWRPLTGSVAVWNGDL